MEDREQLELLCSRFFDADLSEAEKAQLDQALSSDASLRDLFADLERSHDAIGLLVKEWALPAGFGLSVRASLSDAPGQVIDIQPEPWTSYAAAAAAVFVVGLVSLTVWLFQPQEPAPTQLAKELPVRPVTPTSPNLPSPPSVLVYSDGEIRVTPLRGAATRTKLVLSDISLPATITAPSDEHAVIRLRHGLAVLAPGASARISDDDLDGVLDVEPVAGDLYIEARQEIRTHVARIQIRLSHGGITLRQVDGTYFAEPSHGRVVIGDGEIICDGDLADLRRAMISELGRVTYEEYQSGDLDGWAAAGRADEIKQQLKLALGDAYERIPAQLWERWDEMLAGLATRPRERATNAHMLRFMVKNGLFDQAVPEARRALLSIADILAEGTTEDDVPERLRAWFVSFEEMKEQEPAMFEAIMRGMRENLEKLGRRMHEAHPGPPRKSD